MVDRQMGLDGNSSSSLMTVPDPVLSISMVTLCGFDPFMESVESVIIYAIVNV